MADDIRNFTLDSLDSLKPEELAAFDAAALYDLQKMFDEAEAKLKARKQLFQVALSAKYKDRPETTGTIHIDDGDFDISVEVKKKVEWDEDKLVDEWNLILDAQQNPALYIKASYMVPESVFNNFPPEVKTRFESIRKVIPQKPTFSIRDKTETPTRRKR